MKPTTSSAAERRSVLRSIMSPPCSPSFALVTGPNCSGAVPLPPSRGRGLRSKPLRDTPEDRRLVTMRDRMAYPAGAGADATPNYLCSMGPPGALAGSCSGSGRVLHVQRVEHDLAEGVGGVAAAS